MTKLSWDEIKSLGRPEPQLVNQPVVQIVNVGTKKRPSFVALTRRNKRRPVSGRMFHDSVRKSAKAARLTPVDPDGRASAIRLNRAQRRIDREATS